jgi:hypothetical protein
MCDNPTSIITLANYAKNLWIEKHRKPITNISLNTEILDSKPDQCIILDKLTIEGNGGSWIAHPSIPKTHYSTDQTEYLHNLVHQIAIKEIEVVFGAYTDSGMIYSYLDFRNSDQNLLVLKLSLI